MKQKISMLIDAEIVRFAKQRAAEEQRTLSDLIQEALIKYLREDARPPQERKMAYRLFCEQPIKIPLKQLRYILKKDVWSL
jgi:Family of unknown function (DUF6364)